MKGSSIERQIRRHHNNKGYGGLKSGSYYKELEHFAKVNGIPFGRSNESVKEDEP